MGVKRLEDLHAYQLAVAFKLSVYRLVETHPRAAQDLRFVSQLFEAASGGESNVAEGWVRFVPGEMAQFLRYARSSVGEAKRRVVDGIHRRYFTEEECKEALTLGGRCGAAITGLWKSTQNSPYRPKKRLPTGGRRSQPKDRMPPKDDAM